MRMRRRERGQIIVFAAVIMVAVVGAMALVIDVGIFLIIQRQFQSAADAGALAGAWHDPVCPFPDPASPNSPGMNLCLGPKSTGAPTAAERVARQLAQVNGDRAAGLCGGAVTVTVPSPDGGVPRNVPKNVRAIVVTVECDAGYMFGRILPGLITKHISASAAAAIGDRSIGPSKTVGGGPDCTSGGDITDFTTAPPCGRIARLLE